MGKKKGIVERAYSAVMGTSKTKGDPTVGKAAGLLRGRGASNQAAIDKALGNTGARTDLNDTGAGWDES